MTAQTAATLRAVGTLLAVTASFGAGLAAGVQRDPAPPAPTTTSTSEPYCIGESLVIEGTGIVDFAPRCEQPLEHAPEGTGPNTGPRGERRTP